MPSVLIVDDDELTRDSLSTLVSRMGHTAFCEATLKGGLSRASSMEFEILFLDIQLPDGNGLKALPTFRAGINPPEIIIITGYGSSDGAELAIRNGAWDYIEKGANAKDIALAVTRALQYQTEKKKISRPPMVLKRDGILGNSAPLQICLDHLAQSALSDANVLITGETGTGKELFAKAVHVNSRRASKNFVIVDSTALPETLVESILFGHEKGAYTGADMPKEGLIRQAHEGTLFLDEVGELPLSVQKRFLRVLQEHRFRPLGGKREIESDFRLVAATNSNLEQKVASGTFREDLLFRLRTFTIELPPLKDRPEDIKEIVVNYVAVLSEQYGLGAKGFSPDFIGALTAYDWPGNVRELINALEKAILGARYEPILFPKHLPDHIRVRLATGGIKADSSPQSAVRESIPPMGSLPTMREFRETGIANLERSYLQDLLSLSRDDPSEACLISGLSRSRLYGLLKKHNIRM